MSTSPHDDPRIATNDNIIRRIDPKEHIVPDENRGGSRLSSKAFSPSSGDGEGMSVDIEKLILAAGKPPREFVTTPKFTGSVVFPASVPRTKNLWVGHDPILDHSSLPDNPYHGQVWGNPTPNKFKTSQKKALMKGCQWFVEIPGVVIPK